MSIKPIQNLVPQSKYAIKCPYTMTPTRIVVHNTANDASARNEVAYMISNNDYTSYHFAIDDKEVIQALPLNRNGWHAGDGGGKGNMEGIGIEICYSLSGGSKFTAAEKLAAKFIAQLLKERNWGFNKVTKHQDYMDKYCPHRTLDLGWDRFLKMVAAELNTLRGEIVETKPKPTIKFRVKTKNGWLKEGVTGDGNAIRAIAIKPSAGSIKYRVHVKGSGWLPYVTGYDTKDNDNGFAGNGSTAIDAVQIVYANGYRAKYRVAPKSGNFYDYQYNKETTGGQDGYAGCFGQSCYKFQVVIV